MKKSLILLTLVAMTSWLLAANAENPDIILGTWMVPKQDASITITKCADKFCGEITWLKNPNDLDVKNPDKARRADKLVGKKMFWGFVYNGKGKWEKGEIYDPDSGDTYKCIMWMDGEKLVVKGYVGIPLFGRAESWTRVKK